MDSTYAEARCSTTTTLPDNILNSCFNVLFLSSSAASQKGESEAPCRVLLWWLLAGLNVSPKESPGAKEWRGTDMRGEVQHELLSYLFLLAGLESR
ncbi:hypothetical protein INR49_011080 [Caranx melampygus]|nr:hypothetical protein INR49_011080 [Caranx melampygus]